MATPSTGGEQQKAEKSYFTAAVDSLNPWAAKRSTTPTPKDPAGKDSKGDRPKSQQGKEGAGDVSGDHSITHVYGQSLRTYPEGCPPIQTQWFYAVDVPKRKPQWTQGLRASKAPNPPAAQPKKFSAFSAPDSRSIEARYQKLLEAQEDRVAAGGPKEASASDHEDAMIPVNEDFLFDVDIRTRELAPVYWLGPVYEVRRGTWFYLEGSTLKPCEENLAAQLEEGYLKLKPWQQASRARSRSASAKLTSKASSDSIRANARSQSPNPKPSADAKAQAQAASDSFQPQSYRLFGTYMNNLATYQDANTAWLSTEGMLSWVTSSMYEKFAGGGWMSGIKLVRGYDALSKGKEKSAKEATKDSEKDSASATEDKEDPLGPDKRQQKLLNRRSAPPESKGLGKGSHPHTSLQRQISSLLEEDAVGKEEQIRRQQEEQMQEDYKTQAGETQERDIEHVILVTHGIGQLLGMRMESINFVHDVNVLRKTLKSVYTNSADLKALNSELGSGPGNCRVQVLPVCWRHLLDFPRQREDRGERDLGDAASDEDIYPSLQDITIEGVAFARSLISDLALDVLLYQSSYREHISKIVWAECNRIYKLFRKRNPDFKGKVHVMGHSLGSAIMFDILCRQQESRPGDSIQNPLRILSSPDKDTSRKPDHTLDFEFDVADFYCLGSPVGLFQMLKGRTIAARHAGQGVPSESPLNPEEVHDPFLAAMSSGPERVSEITGLPVSVSSPKVQQMYNIFNPSDPISYRLEPLISPSMSQLKPQLLPYTKKGIFGNVAPQGITGIGAMVGQGVSGLWSSFSAGIANNLINRGLGLTNDEVARITASAQQQQNSQLIQTPGAAPTVGGVTTEGSPMEDKVNERKKLLADSTTSDRKQAGNDPTLIDDELETLYSKFQERIAKIGNEDEAQEPSPESWERTERRARKLRMEEGKVRALNRNGRVDYSVQESVLDFNPMNTIASHLGYWADEDVSHFILSQLLSKREGK